MAPKGKFTERDPSDVIDLLDTKVLKSGVGRLFRRFDGVGIRPIGASSSPRSMRDASAAGMPQATISKAGLFGANATVHFWGPDGMSEDEAAQRVTTASLDAAEPRRSFGQYFYDFPSDVNGTRLVQFALAGLRALGAQPADEQWEWWATEPEGD